MKNKPTNEQKLIIDAYKETDNIKVYAFAGCGKTSTLQLLTDTYDKDTFLYLAFNKAIQLEAEEKFGNNVEVKTTHSLAYRYIVLPNNYKVRNFDYKIVELKTLLGESDFNRLSLVLNTFNKFLNSDLLYLKDLMDNVTIPLPDFMQKKVKENSISQSVVEEYLKVEKEKVESLVKDLFSLMHKGQIDITHSFYLKKFQLLLAHNKLKIEPYDCVLIDEFQDTNPVTFSIFKNLPAKKRIAVGDNHQAIYSFRGAKNALQDYDTEIDIQTGDTLYNVDTLHLTNSFRLIPAIGSKVDNFLKIFLSENNTFKGIAKVPTKKGFKPKTTAYLSRTNASLLMQLKVLIDIDEVDKTTITTIRDPYRIFGLILTLTGLVKGTNARVPYEYSYLEKYLQEFSREDISLKLLQANKATEVGENPFYATLPEDTDLKSLHTQHKDKVSLFKLYEASVKYEDMELKYAIKAILDLGYEDINRLYGIVQTNFNSRKKKTIFLSTIHTAKGLEYDKVVLLSDINILNPLLLLMLKNPITSKQHMNKQYPNFISMLQTNPDIFLEERLKQRLFNATHRMALEELNLIYVGATRAKYILEIENEVTDIAFKCKDFSEFVTAFLSSIKLSNINKLVDTTCCEDEDINVLDDDLEI